MGDVFADLGCGTGAYSASFANYHPKKMILVDIDADNIAKCKQALAEATTEKEFIIAPLETLTLADASIDCIFMIEVLDHVHDVARCFEQAYRFLKPGGRLYIAVPNRLFPIETHPVKWRGKLHMPYYYPHLPWFPKLHSRMATARVFSTTDITTFAAKAGFLKPNIDYIMPPFEHRKSNLLRSISRVLERSPLRCFGVSTCAVMLKPAL